MAELRELRALARIQKRLEKTKDMVAEFDENTSLMKIRGTLRVLNDDWLEFRGLEKVIKGVSDEVEKIISDIEETHHSLKTELVIMEEELKGDEGEMNTTISDLLAKQSEMLERTMRQPENDVRLPQLNISPFHGNYEDFPSFRDLFEASVHNNKKIPKVQKLQYLIGLLRGKAKDDIQYVEITANSYDGVWEKMKEKYDKKKLIVSALIKRFLEQSNVTSHDNPTSLRKLADTSDEVLRGLKMSGEDAEKRDPWLIHILLSKLDHETKLAWARETSDVTFPEIETFIKFLNQRCDDYETCISLEGKTKQKTKPLRIMQANAKQELCVKCNGDHKLFNCREFLSMNVHQRKSLVAEQRLCFICLSKNHNVNVCKSRHRCKTCKRKHNSLIHQDASSYNQSDDTNEQTNVQCNEIQVNTISSNFEAILPTAKVNICGRDGQMHQFRALIDSGSQASLISEGCMQKVLLPRWHTQYTIKGFNSKDVKTRGATEILIESQYDRAKKLKVNALIVNKLPAPPKALQKINCGHLVKLELADPDYYKSRQYDILLGADEFLNIIRDQKIRNAQGDVIAQDTIFGWIVAGKSRALETNMSSNHNALVDVKLDNTMDVLLRKFWEVENIPEVKLPSPDDEYIEEYYKSTLQIKNGRYQVRLPIKPKAPKMGDSFQMASKRLLAMERKFKKDVSLKTEYHTTINDYLSLGHMKEVVEESPNEDDEICYLPHHAVIKESSDTTKVRVVFDGSAKSSNGVSLNSKLLVGPTIQPTLWSILLRFRHHKIGITADVEKMYRQILVDPVDQHYQRILWRTNEDKIIKYQLTTVTFGLASSSFLAIRSLQQIANEVKDSNPEIAKIITDDFYVDDMLTGADTEREAKEIKDLISAALLQRGFPLRKWKSNYADICDGGSKADNLAIVDKDVYTQVLGLYWDSTSDVFKFKVNIDINSPVTKRNVISETARLFDPLGWLAPYTVMLKIFYQTLWQRKLDWDEVLPEAIANQYKKLKSEIDSLCDVKIPRFIKYSHRVQYHCFCDASEKAYSAVVYMRTVDEAGNYQTALVTAKTKVAPIKTISLPRLELCGAHLLAKLVRAVKTEVEDAEYYAWTDSSIVLAWLTEHPSNWKTFIANRCSEILEVLPRCNWNHVRSKENPADLATRGVLPTTLLNLRIWWHGPDWLMCNQDRWPKFHQAPDITKVEKEQRKQRVQLLVANLEENICDRLLEKFSDYTKVLRILAYVKRFIQIKCKKVKISGNITTKELKEAEILCVRSSQREFQGEIEKLSKGLTIQNKSKLLSLNPILDDQNVLRVGGRLENSNLSYDAKHPIILPQRHALSKSLVSHYHKRYLHSGPTTTLNLIRQKFWIVHGRSLTRNELKGCISCFKYRPNVNQQIMGHLPASRISPSRAFCKCGVDYAGPVNVLNKKGRGAVIEKSYIAIFVCMVTKAVHIELVTELSTDAFIAALKRFAARRGMPSDIYSDNAKNFVGACKEIKRIKQLVQSSTFNSNVADFLCNQGTQWHFIPPYSPNFGGLWEAAVKSVKGHLIKSCGMQNMTFEELYTLLCKIEAILNSRPICASVNDDSSYSILTPNHFINGSASNLFPEDDYSEVNLNRLDRWHRICKQSQYFWRKFNLDYLNTLNQRNKWKEHHKNLQIGDIVLLKDDNSPSYKWAHGRITSTSLDSQGQVRVVQVKTPTATLERAISKVCKLPLG